MFSDPRKIHVVLTLINKHPKELVPFSVHLYNNYFSQNTVPPEKIIHNDRGEPSVIMVSKTKAINYLKNKYMFVSKADAKKVLEEEHAYHNLR